jgi:hypothetical protein
MQNFTAAEVDVLDKLENLAIGVRAFSSSRDGLSANRCAKLVELLTEAPPIPKPSLPVQDGRAVATLVVLEAVLGHIRHEVTEGSLGGGLSHERSHIVNRLANMIHNLPKIIAGNHWALRFDEHWLLSMMRAFDRRAGTRLENVYRDALATQAKPDSRR